ncbi:MAG: polymer-forming cytoskeletal protein [Elusimicrobia bacterium]|nr:polymer-forming cytoskeletal protein [Elusimicrobiota bacterium]
MAMFSGKGEGPSSEAVTLVGEEAYFHGVLAAKGSLRIEGVVEGDITDAITVEIGKKGKVKGNIAAETLSVAGAVEGDVVASRAIEVHAKGRLTGNIKTPRLRIDDGGFFDGTCAMTSAEDSAQEGSSESYQSAHSA